MDKVSMSHLFPSQDIKQNLLLSSCDVINLKIFLDQPLKQSLAGVKRGENKNTKTWISQEWKELFRWNKKSFSCFLKGYHLVGNKNLIKNSGHKL